MKKIIIYKTGDKNQQYQGDISVISNVAIKTGLKFEPLKTDFVIAEGEVTGHKHRLVSAEGSQIEIAQDGVGYYLRITKGSANLVHEEHDTITKTKFDEGLHYFGRQYEFDEQQEYRQIAD